MGIEDCIPLDGINLINAKGNLSDEELNLLVKHIRNLLSYELEVDREALLNRSAKTYAQYMSFISYQALKEINIQEILNIIENKKDIELKFYSSEETVYDFIYYVAEGLGECSVIDSIFAYFINPINDCEFKSNLYELIIEWSE